MREDSTPTASIGQQAAWACLWEATAPKPGNVHRGADFDDVTFAHFATSAVAIGATIDRLPAARPGELALACVQAMRASVATNTHLGTLLLLAPLAVAARQPEPLRVAVATVLDQLDPSDTAGVYAAIRSAQPGGLGRVETADVADRPPSDLRAAMRLAADRDRVARQYVDNFSDVFQQVVPWVAEGVQAGWGLSAAIVHTHLRLLAAEPDSLIARKCGCATAQEATARAAVALAAGLPGQGDYHAALADFDFWLRSDGHRRNPGTTADLIAAGLFAALVEGIITWPLDW